MKRKETLLQWLLTGAVQLSGESSASAFAEEPSSRGILVERGAPFHPPDGSRNK